MMPDQSPASVKRYEPAVVAKNWNHREQSVDDVIGLEESGDGRCVMYHDYDRAIAERDAAQAECDRLTKSLRLYPDLNAINKDLDRANEVIRNMGEAADKERQGLRAEVAILKRIISDEADTITDQSFEVDKLREQVERLKRELAEVKRTYGRIL